MSRTCIGATHLKGGTIYPLVSVAKNVGQECLDGGPPVAPVAILQVVVGAVHGDNRGLIHSAIHGVMGAGQAPVGVGQHIPVEFVMR